MFRPIHIRHIQKLARFVPSVPTPSKPYSSTIKQDPTIEKTPSLGNISDKYEVFDEKNSEIILDVYEERLKYASMLEAEEEDEDDPYSGLNMERGVTGVLDIEDLVEVLKVENAQDIFVARVPKEYKYVDYMCLATGKSQKHMQAIIQFVRKVYKHKRHKGDPIPHTEGVDSKDWIAIDLGNIALHIFSNQARGLYDLDSLWALGRQYDDECNKPESVSEMLEKHSLYLKDLEPAS